MNAVKRLLGLLWIAVGIISIIVLIGSAVQYIDPSGSKEINKPIPWIIIITIFTPIGIGMMIFGWYAFKGAYNEGADEQY